MLDFLSWYLLISVSGWLFFPITYRFLPALSDRGYASTRALGLLLWGYLVWILASLGIIHFSSGGILLSLALLIGLNFWLLRSTGITPLKEWLTSNKKYILTVEILFLVSFMGWTLVRAANPEVLGTEKPMELAFINSILNSTTFPPHDPWLSGYGISYYYFGYVLVSLLAKILHTSGGVTFNLGISLIFALSAIGAYSLVYNLLKSTKGTKDTAPDSLGLHATRNALLAPLFLLIVSNLEGFLHSLHTRGVFWTKDQSGALSSKFWSWLDIKDLSTAPVEPFSWQPTRFWWWWRASRVVQDYDLSGAPREIIDEFPFFSFLLADLHPHVLAIPFALLSMTLALNLILGGAKGKFKWFKLITVDINLVNFLLLAVVLGGIAFLNTWDLPAQLILVSTAMIFPIAREYADKFSIIFGKFLSFALLLGISSVLIYLPFYLSFSSQAGGLLPNLIYPTRGAHLWVMFAPFLIPLFGYLLDFARQKNNLKNLQSGLLITLVLFIGLFVFALGLGYLITLIPEAKNIYLASQAAPDYASLLKAAFERRLEQAGGWITLAAFLTLSLGLLSGYFRKLSKDRLLAELSEETDNPRQLQTAYILVVASIGALLVTAPEFVYLRDQFGWRMNTIFKFYYQAWILWSIVAAYASIFLVKTLSGRSRLLVQVGLGLLILASLVYPLFSLWSKTNAFSPAYWTLDGVEYLRRQSPEEMAAIDWLQSAPAGVVAEAVPPAGGSYTQYGRVSMLSGKPALLGWMGHESQWRGGNEAMGTRQLDLERLYCSSSWQETQSILDQYQIRYIFIGSLERSTYQPEYYNCQDGIVENKFIHNLSLVFQLGQTSIYEFLSVRASP